MNIMGVDLSTKAVTAVMLDHEENLVDWWHVEMAGENALERCRDAALRLREIPWDDPSIIAFERPAGSSVRVAMDIWRMMGVILGMRWYIPVGPTWDEDVKISATTPVIPLSTPIWEFTPSDWKKKAGLRGDATKEMIVAFVDAQRRKTRAPLTGPSLRGAPQDAYDAYCVALAAVRENRKGL